MKVTQDIEKGFEQGELEYKAALALHDPVKEVVAARNILFKGDNLAVMAKLRELFAARVKLIYIDPPYNTGNKLTYTDTFTRTSWVEMMTARLLMARKLMRKDGCIVVSIGDQEVVPLRLIMDEIFGPENFIAQLTWQKRTSPSNNAKFVSSVAEPVLMYRRSAALKGFNRLARPARVNDLYTNPDKDPRGDWKGTALDAPTKGGGGRLTEYTFPNGVVLTAPSGRVLGFAPDTLLEMYQDNRIHFPANGKPKKKTFLFEVSGMVSTNLLLSSEADGDWADHKTSGGVDDNSIACKGLNKILEAGTFDYPKPVSLIRRFIQMATAPDQGHIVMDFFAGSGTTGHAVLAQNKEDRGDRMFILVQREEELPGKPGSNLAMDVTYRRIAAVIEEMEKDKKKSLIRSREAPLSFSHQTL